MKLLPHTNCTARLLAAAVAAAAIATFTVKTLSQAPEPERLREEAANLERKARDLKADGRAEESMRAMRQAEELARRADEMGKKGGPGPGEVEAKRQALKRELEGLRAKLKELVADGKQDAAAEVKGQIQRVEMALKQAAGPGEAEAKRQALKGDLERLRARLKEAEADGKEQEAAEIRGKIERLENALKQPPKPEGRPQGDAGPPARRRVLIREAVRVQPGMEARRERAERPQMEGRAPRPRPEGPPAEVEGPEARARHLEVAIEHLHAAGLHDAAERLARQAENLRRAPRGEPRPERPAAEALMGELNELRGQVNELREQLGEMRRFLEEARRERR